MNYKLDLSTKSVVSGHMEGTVQVQLTNRNQLWSHAWTDVNIKIANVHMWYKTRLVVTGAYVPDSSLGNVLKFATVAALARSDRKRKEVYLEKRSFEQSLIEHACGEEET